jgi:predicted enzyme related to lactoylglutathione lyase/quinol monooxygenase YgiN
LTSRWFIRPGLEVEVVSAVTQLAARVQAEEPDTLIYLAHLPCTEAAALQSLPPSEPGLLLFFEMYRNPQAFLGHVNGPIFKQFVQQHGSLFVPSAQGSPYTTVEFLSRRAGFIRSPQTAAASGARAVAPPTNQHPALMFEIIANDQAKAQAFYSSVFGWTYQSGTGDFAYVQFPKQVRALLGGIGQASAQPGFEPGHNFYLAVDNLESTISAAITAGGALYMPIAAVDGYRFAMVRDPEGNPIGLIEPFEGRSPIVP